MNFVFVPKTCENKTSEILHLLRKYDRLVIFDIAPESGFACTIAQYLPDGFTIRSGTYKIDKTRNGGIALKYVQ
jgi:hypothetical protein